jgi:hypothetical protein
VASQEVTPRGFQRGLVGGGGGLSTGEKLVQQAATGIMTPRPPGGSKTPRGTPRPGGGAASPCSPRGRLQSGGKDAVAAHVAKMQEKNESPKGKRKGVAEALEDKLAKLKPATPPPAPVVEVVKRTRAWTCPRCTMVNACTASFCGMCGEDAPPVGVISNIPLPPAPTAEERVKSGKSPRARAGEVLYQFRLGTKEEALDIVASAAERARKWAADRKMIDSVDHNAFEAELEKFKEEGGAEGDLGKKLAAKKGRRRSSLSELLGDPNLGKDPMKQRRCSFSGADTAAHKVASPQQQPSPPQQAQPHQGGRDLTEEEAEEQGRQIAQRIHMGKALMDERKRKEEEEAGIAKGTRKRRSLKESLEAPQEEEQDTDLLLQKDDHGRRRSVGGGVGC